MKYLHPTVLIITVIYNSIFYVLCLYKLILHWHYTPLLYNAMALGTNDDLYLFVCVSG